ncbi:MAG: redoxin domain-containing protein [Candidatus Zixiibacteriota bacterium]
MRKGLLAAFGLIMLAGVAWWAGSAIGELLGTPDNEMHFQRRQEMTQAFLERSDVIEVGAKWPDFTLQTLDGEWTSFSQLIKDTTILLIVQPGCESCELELDGLGSLLTDTATCSRIVLVSDGYPLDLAQIRKSRMIRSPILIDRGREMSASMGGFIYPLNITVSPDLTIISVVAGRLTEEEALNKIR